MYYKELKEIVEKKKHGVVVEIEQNPAKILKCLVDAVKHSKFPSLYSAFVANNS